MVKTMHGHITMF